MRREECLCRGSASVEHAVQAEQRRRGAAPRVAAVAGGARRADGCGGARLLELRAGRLHQLDDVGVGDDGHLLNIADEAVGLVRVRVRVRVRV